MLRRQAEAAYLFHEITMGDNAEEWIGAYATLAHELGDFVRFCLSEAEGQA